MHEPWILRTFDILGTYYYLQIDVNGLLQLECRSHLPHSSSFPIKNDSNLRRD